MDARERLGDNPFLVLGLGLEASTVEVEREGLKLLGMLELGMDRAKTYMSPLGLQSRTPEKVREAMAELRAPDRRLLHELWHLDEEPSEAPEAPAAGAPQVVSPAPWEGALRALGWGSR